MREKEKARKKFNLFLLTLWFVGPYFVDRYISRRSLVDVLMHYVYGSRERQIDFNSGQKDLWLCRAADELTMGYHFWYVIKISYFIDRTIELMWFGNAYAANKDYVWKVWVRSTMSSLAPADETKITNILIFSKKTNFLFSRMQHT